MRITEHNYLEQLNYGNEAALEYVVKTYGGLVKSVVKRHLYNLQQYEEDCINDVYFAVWTHISNYCPERNSFANWIAGIARLKSLDYVRKYLSGGKEVYLEEAVLNNILTENIDDELSGREISREMEQMLSCLKEEDRELFYRLYVNEQTMDEIQEQMETDKTVLYNRLSRAKKRLRKRYGRA